jgi:hypothetical protein
VVTRWCGLTLWTDACLTPGGPRRTPKLVTGTDYLIPTEEVGGDKAVWSHVTDNCLPHTQGPGESLDYSQGQTGVGSLYLSPTEKVGGDEAVRSHIMDQCLPHTQGPERTSRLVTWTDRRRVTLPEPNRGSRW